MSKTIDRILQLVNQLDLSARQFDLSIGTGNGYLLRMHKNSASVGRDVIEQIKKVYPQVNLVWLLTGQGDMFVKEETSKARSAEEIKSYIDEKLHNEHSKEHKALLEEILKEIESITDNKN